MRPVITITTDFGEGSYVAQIKGVLLSLCREATVVDLSHELPAHDVSAAAWLLRDVVPTFPPGTVHLVVVDPGVGTDRRGIAMRTEATTARGQNLVGPDNGIFSPFFEGSAVHELGERAPRRATVSPVFHGRDVFAPAAAHIARGGAAESLGSPLRDPVRIELPNARASGGEVAGEALFADHFGNIATNIESSQLPNSGWSVEVGGTQIDRVVPTYGDAEVGELVALIGSSGRLEIAVREGSSADRLKFQRGMPVRVTAR